MNKNCDQKLEEIRKACIAANPAIMELGPGCQIRPKNREIKDKLYKWEWGDDKGEHEHFPIDVLYYEPDGETYEERELIEGKLVVGWFDPFGEYVTRRDGRDYLCVDDFEEDLEILGRPILPHDIAKILPRGWMMKWDAGMKRYEFVNMENHGKPSFENRYISWNDDRLEENIPESIDSIHSLLTGK